jgi:Tetratricopeptide repeat
MKSPRVTLSCAVIPLVFLLFPIFSRSQTKSRQDVRGSLSGKVLIEGENAASQVRGDLRMIAGNVTGTAITDPHGNFRLEAIPAGTCFVNVAAPGCIPFEETLQVDSSTAPVLVRLRKNNHVPASASASSSISVHELTIPSKARRFFDKGNQLLAAKNPADAISEYQRAIKAFPADYEAYYKIGIAELSQERGAEAEAALRKAVERSEGRYVERRFAEAESAAREHRQLDATDATGHYARRRLILSENSEV